MFSGILNINRYRYLEVWLRFQLVNCACQQFQAPSCVPLKMKLNPCFVTPQMSKFQSYI